jgi:hypothetical protein
MWKSAIVLEKGKSFENFQSFDPRLNSPFITGSDVTSEKVLLQYVDKIMVENNRFSFFTPNTVALLFSMAEKSGVEAMELLDQIKSRSKNENHINGYDRKVLIDDSKLVCEYLEQIQAAVVFSFTAIESFINISIPSEYVYQVNTNKKTESYNKEQIERSVRWQDKITKIMVDIYKTDKIESERFWVLFLKLVDIRNNIIHQKSTNDTSYIETLLDDNIFSICCSANQVYEYFLENALNRFKLDTEFQGREDLWPGIRTYIPDMVLKKRDI